MTEVLSSTATSTKRRGTAQDLMVWAARAGGQVAGRGKKEV